MILVKEMFVLDDILINFLEKKRKRFDFNHKLYKAIICLLDLRLNKFD